PSPAPGPHAHPPGGRSISSRDLSEPREHVARGAHPDGGPPARRDPRPPRPHPGALRPHRQRRALHHPRGPPRVCTRHAARRASWTGRPAHPEARPARPRPRSGRARRGARAATRPRVDRRPDMTSETVTSWPRFLELSTKGRLLGARIEDLDLTGADLT